MKEKLILITLSVLSALLTACGAETDASKPQNVIDWSELSGAASDETAAGETPSVEAPPATVGETVTPETEQQTTLPVDESSSDLYRQLYTQAVTENDDPVSFSLIYLDNDAIPELVVWDSYYGAYSIYTVKDGAVACMVDSLSTVELTYFERSGIIASFARWNGGGDEGGYGLYYYQATTDSTVTDDTMPVLSYDYNAIYDEAGNYTGEGITRYYSMGEETDVTTHQELLSGFGITENSDRLCTENFLTKEEMLSTLNQ